MKIQHIFLLAVSFFFAVSSYAFAEKIESFNSVITLGQKDGIRVEETILYNSEGLTKHGIYRDIPLDTVLNNPVHHTTLSDIKITDESGNNVHYETISVYQGGQSIIRYKIGDAGDTFEGKKTYHISYLFNHALSKTESGAELYYNVTGNAWTMPIEKSSFHIKVDGGLVSFKSEDLKCFTGSFGESTTCHLEEVIANDSSYSASYGTSLSSGEGLTVRLPLRVNGELFVSPLFANMLNYGGAFFSVALSILFILIATYFYRKYGKDPIFDKPIIAEYEPPKGVTLLESSYIVNESIASGAIGAQIISEAQNGNLKIEGKETQFLFIKSLVFYLTVIRQPENEASQFLLASLSRGVIKIENIARLLTKKFSEKDSEETLEPNATISLSDTKIQSSDFEKINDSVKNSLLAKNIFERIFSLWLKNKTGNLKALLPYVTVLLFLPLLLLLFAIALAVFDLSSGWTFLPSVVGIICIVSLLRSFNKKTLYGSELKHHLLGLKKYIEVVEKERIKVLNAPSKTPELFIKLLPWAMLFGLEKKWVKEFEDIEFTQNDVPFFVMTGAMSASHFSSTFISSVESFSTVVSQASATASSGGSGGGSSGGGGGGGGGGSW